AYGEAGLAPASIYAAATIFLFNVLGVITLSRAFAQGNVSFVACVKQCTEKSIDHCHCIGLCSESS
ncbi:hypothetical protein AAUPMC_07627, partial [Pasteurella multocida subsp. multocida str. Anand1_cattle]